MKRVTIYSTQYCAWCAAAKDLMRKKRVYFDEIDCTGDLAMRQKLEAMTGGLLTVPQIWIGGVHVGGYRDLVELDKEGRLDALLGVADTSEMAMGMA